MRLCNNSFFRNHIDRLLVMEQHELLSPDRLKAILPEHLYFMAYSDLEASKNTSFVAALWNKVFLNTNRDWLFSTSPSKIPPLIHYDSQTLLVFLSTTQAIYKFQTNASKLALFRMGVQASLVHCLYRSLIVSLLNSPREKRTSILESLCTMADSSVKSPMDAYLKTRNDLSQSTIMARPQSQMGDSPNVCVEKINDFVQTNLLDFVRFALKLATELKLIDSHGVSQTATFDSVFEDSLKLLLDSSISLSSLIDKIGHTRTAEWIADFGNFLDDDMVSCYPDYIWTSRTLRSLPESYDTLFNAYFGKKCNECLTAPLLPVICLVCGRLLCLDACCNLQLDAGSPNQISEVEAHSYTCSSGSGCFLSLSSTMIVLFHRRTASLWGSIFLDAHGEEDRNQRRGKTLYLSKSRYEKLRQIWLSSDFERNLNASRVWFDVQKLPNILQESHNLP